MLAQLALLLALGFIPCLMSHSSLTAPPGDASKEEFERQVDSWIKDLESERFETREAATLALMKLEDEPANLRTKLKSSNLEVRQRVARILEAYAPKRAKRGLAQVKVLAKEGRVDEMVERLILWKEYDTGEGWKALAELAARLAARVDFTCDKTHFRWFVKPEERGESRELIFDETKLRWVNKPLEGIKQPKEELMSKSLAKHWQSVLTPIRDEKVLLDPQGRPRSREMIIASGDVTTPQFGEGIITAGGSLQLKQVSGAVVICDGKCELKNQIQDSLIIARGKVTFSPGVSCNHSVILGEDSIDGMEHLRLVWSMISNGYPNGFVKFFHPWDVGISAWNVLDKKGQVVPDGTQIIKLREGTPFASKLRAKDLVTAIDETKTPTFEVFRKALRRKLAENIPTITFTVQRADKILEVPISLKD
jgi:hypothetical protein